MRLSSGGFRGGVGLPQRCDVFFSICDSVRFISASVAVLGRCGNVHSIVRFISASVKPSSGGVGMFLRLLPGSLGLQELASQVGFISYPLALMALPVQAG